ncbi:hypothetical protein Tco_0892627 [Tanacetum coccineum]|uniref:Aminotransferase-like plant mobile domain-containing protein n=1 Tax=Tanacetum coccineum TaxID=301880 RepID=A0ABQ5C6G2_9ASTR
MLPFRCVINGLAFQPSSSYPSIIIGALGGEQGGKRVRWEEAIRKKIRRRQEPRREPSSFSLRPFKNELERATSTVDTYFHICSLREVTPPSKDVFSITPTRESTACVTPFIRWIEDYLLPDGLKIPPHVGSYNGKGDHDNYLHLFEGATRMQKWAMHVACHMFWGEIPLRPIRRIHQGRYGVSMPALTKDHRGIKLNTPYPEDQYAVLEIWNEYNILEDIKRGPYSKKSPIRRIQSLDTPATFRIPSNFDDGNPTTLQLLKLPFQNFTSSSIKFNLASTQISSKGTCSVRSAKHFLRVDDNLHDLRSVEAEFPAIDIDDAFAPQDALPCKSQVSTPVNDEIDFRISFDESDDEDYTIICDKNSFSYKMISVNNLKTDSENDNEKAGIPSFPPPKPTISYVDDLDFFKDFKNEFPAIVYNDAQMSKSDYLTEQTLSPQHNNESDLNDETSLSEYDEVGQNVLYFNDLFPFNVIHPNDLKSDEDNDNNEIDIIQSSEGNLNTHRSNMIMETSRDKIDEIFDKESFVLELNVNIVTWIYLFNGMLLCFIRNLYVPFGILFDPKRYYKDGDCVIMLRRLRYIFFTLINL